jgi:hypothetical protein
VFASATHVGVVPPIRMCRRIPRSSISTTLPHAALVVVASSHELYKESMVFALLWSFRKESMLQDKTNELAEITQIF